MKPLDHILETILIYVMQLQDCVRVALRRKTVILVTHQVEFLSKVDKILVLSHIQILYFYLFSTH